MSVLSAPLTKLFNHSLTMGQVPSEWTTANVSPIFKKGSKSTPGNYRPISLTCISCKLLETLIKDHIVDHLSRNSIIGSSQHGFVKGRSCTTNLLQFFEVITSNLDNDTAADVVYLDFAKAFDKVPHERLLRKLAACGINNHILAWIRSWLTGRTQRTVLNGKSSRTTDVKSGVPQGSVLGPLLFIIYIEDIDACATAISIINKFADDTKLGQALSDPDSHTKLQQCLDKLGDWASTWCMSFNEKKCTVLHCGRNNPQHTYSLNGVPLAPTTSERDVGIIMCHNLKPSDHCATVAGRARHILGQISRTFHYRDKKTFLKLYTTFVRCHMEFAAPAWSPWLLGDIAKLESVQEQAVRMISGLTSTNYNDKLMELGIESLEVRRRKFDMVETYKIIHGFSKTPHNTWFRLVEDTDLRTTRNRSYAKNIVPCRANLDARKHFFSLRVCNDWNDLPTEIKQATSITKFKQQYTEWRTMSNLEATT